MQKNITLYFFPGSGTDWRMYAPQLDEFSNIVIPEWLPPLDLDETLQSYVLRLKSRIDTSKPFMLGGVSLGGMVAQEMALCVKPLAVILIATCSNARALSLWARLAGRLMRILPDFYCRLQMKLLGWMVRMFVPDTTKHKASYVKMLREMPPRLVRWQSGIATRWALSRKLEVPVYHLHGRRDGIIPCEETEPTQIIEKGGHLINVTHANEVNKFIASCVRRSEPKERSKSDPFFQRPIKQVVH